MTPKEALALAQEAQKSGRCIPTGHCLDRMPERGVQFGDLKRAIRTATSAKQQPNGSWRLYGGTDNEEEELVPVVKFEGDTVHIITILG